MQGQTSPIETPTTPCTPSFPLFGSSSPLPHSRQSSISSIQTVMPTRRCSSFLSPNSTTPTSTGHSIPIIRPLPLRPALSTTPTHSHSHRISKPSQNQHQQQQQQQQQRRSRSCSRSPSPQRSRSPLTHTISPSNHRPQPTQPTLTYSHALSHLSTCLIPLISVTTGLPHPTFPRSLLQYHLLTHAQLDELAVYYHQVVPAVRETDKYPVSIPGWVDRRGEETGAEEGEGVDVEEVEGREREMREVLEREWRRGVERRREEERLRSKAEGWRERW
ncbi:hypothetical protein EPUS_02128 [Endocarpon pusillum Z07020]|uniref:Uncharacterized protein n=1 Tax=Endocarpon pusillum (strain Z07020 / HMAS-L-300199) TaxID=1263415 RepID=U1GK63_ENDPU|nr:uncharacterized protein EPUS_02128 [Endocarpon pusillum Z07020]ERF72241.1 hypothetical protein EPUS_02128 [Endocarpon pusillum Z07020]